jgi:hypothetical protein
MSQDWPLCQQVSQEEEEEGGGRGSSTTSTEMDAFAEKFEDEFSLVATLSSSNRLAELEDSGAWFVDSGSSRHMTGMRSVFLSVSETGSDLHVKNGARTMHAVKGVGCVRFQLESGVSLEVDEVMYVPELKVNLLSISALEDMGYAVMFGWTGAHTGRGSGLGCSSEAWHQARYDVQGVGTTCRWVQGDLGSEISQITCHPRKSVGMT